MVIKPRDINHIHSLLNNFDKNLKFTVDTFTDDVPHFLDLRLNNDDLSIYRKPTNTGVYIHHSSYTPWKFRISWINSLITRAKRICEEPYLSNEIDQVK